MLGELFRGKFVNALKEAFQNGQLHFYGDLKLLAQPEIFAAWLRPLHRQDWVVYLKRPFGGPEYVVHYLGRTPIVWPSPITAWFRSTMGRSLFAGGTPLTTTSRSC